MKEKKRKITHSGELDLAGYKLPCYNLEDGRRVLSPMGVQLALKMVDEDDKQKSGSRLGRYLNKKSFQSLISADKNYGQFEPITCYKGNKKINGFEATVLVDVANIFLEGRKQGILSTDREELIAEQSEIIIRSFAKVGIIALIDEATGYQYEREKFELQKILKTYISEEILKWQETFQIDFYKEIFRLWNIPFTAESIKKKPWFVGKLTSELVYKNLPKGTFVLEKLKEKTPKTKGGNYKYRLHQSLTKKVGKEALKKVINSVEAYAKISETREEFLKLVKKGYPSNKLNNEKEASEVDFDQALKSAINTPPLKLKDLKEQLKKEREKKEKP